MDTFFQIKYNFDKKDIFHHINLQLEKNKADYICVADGVILNLVNRKPDYRSVVNGGMFSICDSSYVPIYIRRLYKKKVPQYTGTNFMEDIVRSGNYRMYFLGSNAKVLNKLKENLSRENTEVKNMKFMELPYKRRYEDFDYTSIAKKINKDNPDIIFVSLGAPKQEYFMWKLKPFLKRGVIVAVGAAFDFCAGLKKKRASKWVVDHHMEFVHRLFQEPKKQSKRCFHIIRTLPKVLYKEYLKSRNPKKNLPVSK